MTRFLAGFLLLSLTACGHFGPVKQSCPQPPPSLLLAEPPLDASKSLPEPIPLPVLVEAYVQDVGRFELLREKHSDLQIWVKTQCLAEK